MYTILGARIAGAALSCLSGLFLLSLLFTQGGSTGGHQEAVAPTPAAPAPEADTEAKLQEQGVAGGDMWDLWAGRIHVDLGRDPDRAGQQPGPQAMEQRGAYERQPYQTPGGKLILVPIVP